MDEQLQKKLKELEKFCIENDIVIKGVTVYEIVAEHEGYILRNGTTIPDGSVVDQFIKHFEDHIKRLNINEI